MPAAELQPLGLNEEGIVVRAVGGADPCLVVSVKLRFRSAQNELPFFVTNWHIEASIGNVRVPVRSVILQDPKKGSKEGTSFADHDLDFEIPGLSWWLSRVERIRRASEDGRVTVAIKGVFWCVHYDDPNRHLDVTKVPFTPDAARFDSHSWGQWLGALGWTPAWAIEFPQPPPVGWERVIPLLTSASNALMRGTPEGVTRALIDCRSAWLEAKQSYELGGQRWMGSDELRDLYNAFYTGIRPPVTHGFLTKEQRMNLLCRGVDLLWNATRNFSEIGVHPEGLSSGQAFEVDWDDAALAYRLTFCLLSYLSSPAAPRPSMSAARRASGLPAPRRQRESGPSRPLSRGKSRIDSSVRR